MAAMTATPLAGAAIAQLEAEGVDTVIGTVVNPAGLTLAKTVPIRRTNTFADPGLGASPTWHAFAIDQTGIAFTDDVTVVGDQRLRIDLSALRIIGDGLAWAPAGFFEQDGTPVPACGRGTLGRIEAGQIAQNLRKSADHQGTILLALTSDEPGEETFSLGFNDGFKKPFDGALLAERVRRLISQKKAEEP